MLINMLKTAARPDFMGRAGETVDLQHPIAKLLIEEKAAVKPETEKKPKESK